MEDDYSRSFTEMIEARRLRKVIQIPQGIEVTVGETIVVKGKGKEISRKLFFPRVAISRQDDTIVLEPKGHSKREKKIINSFRAHLLNMVQGVQEPFVYTLKICAGHFPMTVVVEGRKLVIKNFLGEKVPRVAPILDNVDVKVEGDTVTVTSVDIEAAGQTAANFELATRITNRDRRVFQDGIWIANKGGRA